MKIVILDGYTENPGDLSWGELEKLGELTVYDRTDDCDIVSRAKDADIVISNKTPITKETADALPNMKLCALMSTGYNVVDYEYLGKKGIPVCNIPAYSTEGVAQLVMAFMLEFAVGVGLHTDSVKSGKWENCPDFCYWEKPIFELSGKTLGIVGFGRIGRAVAERAHAFGMKILVYTPHPKDIPDYAKSVSLDEIRANSDIITLHCPLTQDTKNLVDKEFIAGMKTGSYIINTSRGPVIDEQAVADALESGKLAGAAFDVLTNEPPEKNNPIITSDKTFITPHIAWAAFETRERLMDILVSNVKAFIDGKPQNVVNGAS